MSLASGPKQTTEGLAMLPDFENRSFSEVDRQVFETLSDQQVIRKAQTDVAYRYFLGLRKPDHHYSTPGGVG